jgi:hypothetical protein
MCGGCRARAFATQGDYLAEDPACAYEPPVPALELVAPKAVTYGTPVEPDLVWTEEARRRLDRVPSFVRGVVVKRLEQYARATDTCRDGRPVAGSGTHADRFLNLALLPRR